MPSIMATLLRWCTHSARTKSGPYAKHPSPHPYYLTNADPNGRDLLIECLVGWGCDGKILNFKNTKLDFCHTPLILAFQSTEGYIV